MRNACYVLTLLTILCGFCATPKASWAQTPTPRATITEVGDRDANHAAASAGPLQQNAILTEKVPNYAAAASDILDAVTREGGALSGTSSQVMNGGRRNGWLRFRVPADRLPVLVAEARRTGIPYAERMKTSDDSSEYSSLLLRANRLQEHEGRLASVLTADRRLRGSDILYVQERLFRASVDESLLRQKREDYAHKAQSASLLVFLFEPTPINTLSRVHFDAQAQFAYARARAVEPIDKDIQRAVTGSAYALVYAPFYLPFVLIAGFVVYRFRRCLRAAVDVVVGFAVTLASGALSIAKTVIMVVRNRWLVQHPPMPAMPATPFVKRESPPESPHIE